MLYWTTNYASAPTSTRSGVKVDVLRDALSECLAALPDTDPWRDYQELYVLTDPEMSDYTVNG